MAAVSQMPTTLTSSPFVWDDARPTETEKSLHSEKAETIDEELHTSDRPPLVFQNGNSTLRGAMSPEPTPRRDSIEEQGLDQKTNGFEVTQYDHKERKPRSVKDHANSENALDPHGGLNGERAEGTQRRVPGNLYPDSDSDENSKWIHRDKLARIESEELQAAGIFLPRQRDRARSKSQNRPRRDQSQDKMNGSARSIAGSEHTIPRSRKNSTATSAETRTLDLATIPSWDLRRPEEILEEGNGHWANSIGKGSSRIPVAKISGVPIPSEHLARDTRIPRKRDNSPGVEDSITYPKPRARSGSTGNALTKATTAAPASQASKRPDSSPKKPSTTTATRKAKPANGAAGRPKTRGGPSKDSTSSGTGTTRPSTRSGEREFSSSNCRPMEGEPPWMVSAYRPDPRLPPDQQLLPTVAKRLQQEKWEREGKFGSVYDKEFRPLTDEGFLKPPEPAASPDKEPEKEAEKKEQKNGQGEWPLKAEPKSPTLPGRTNSYSTMPKIADPPAANSLPTTKAPSQQAKPTAAVRVPEPQEDPAEKKGCGCCIVM
ncbi:hypothetical protein VTI74DRAFT_5479 [Chaetomium olivicolor]